jgi:ubiquitin carboxyl-terminal hydrolase 9/13
MSFFGKFKPGSTPSQATATAQAAKKDVTGPTPLEKHLADLGGPIRPDGSDKFFGFENYGSTWWVYW